MSTSCAIVAVVVLVDGPNRILTSREPNTSYSPTISPYRFGTSSWYSPFGIVHSSFPFDLALVVDISQVIHERYVLAAGVWPGKCAEQASNFANFGMFASCYSFLWRTLDIQHYHQCHILRWDAFLSLEIIDRETESEHVWNDLNNLLLFPQTFVASLTVDTILTFFRAYRDKNGRMVCSLRAIGRHYIRSGWVFFVA